MGEHTTQTDRTDPEDIAGTLATVVRGDAVIARAYSRGRGDGPSDADTAPEGLGYFKESAQWANDVAPWLRRLSGYNDEKAGTYRIGRPVAVVDAERMGLVEDAVMLDSAEVYDTVAEAYDRGYLDAAHPDDPEGYADLSLP